MELIETLLTSKNLERSPIETKPFLTFLANTIYFT